MVTKFSASTLLAIGSKMQANSVMFNPVPWILKFFDWYFSLPDRKQFGVSLFILGILLLLVSILGLWFTNIIRPQ